MTDIPALQSVDVSQLVMGDKLWGAAQPQSDALPTTWHVRNYGRVAHVVERDDGGLRIYCQMNDLLDVERNTHVLIER